MDEQLIERAVEAGAKALFEASYPLVGATWEDLDAHRRWYLRFDARVVLTAALAEVMPRVQAAAWVEGYDAAAKQHPTTTFLGARNPYRKETT